MSEIIVIPYVRMDGEWSLHDGTLLEVAQQAHQDGMLRHAFYDGTVRTPQDFLEAMKAPGNHPVFVFLGQQPGGFAWLNNTNATSAFCHFCTLKRALGRTIEMGRRVVAYWREMLPEHVLLGLTPANNPKALGFVKRLGFEQVGEVPGLLYDAYDGDRVAGVISYYRS